MEGGEKVRYGYRIVGWGGDWIFGVWKVGVVGVRGLRRRYNLRLCKDVSSGWSKLCG